MIHYLKYSAVLLFILVSMDSCKKETEFQEVIRYAKESSLVINSMSGLLETAFDVMSYNTKVSDINNTLINEDGSVFFTDKYFFDNNGVACIISFGDRKLGTKGYDYRYKSGKMEVKMSSYYADANNKITITMNTPDKLRVHHEYEYEKFESYDLIGLIEIRRIDGDKWFYETKNFTMESSKKKLNIELAGYLDISDGRLEGFIDNFYTATYSGNINKEYSIYTPEQDALTKDLGKDCTANYQKGIYFITTEKGINAKMNFDPYNNEACDPYAKLSWSSKEELITLP